MCVCVCVCVCVCKFNEGVVLQCASSIPCVVTHGSHDNPTRLSPSFLLLDVLLQQLCPTVKRCLGRDENYDLRMDTALVNSYTLLRARH